ncbi:MAG TPA: FAD-dependent oxidoreductase, partial [Dehalococcoidia bacterium]|nr:FAD-dependent oxidoreductase [Dehalococcoidia bacterium]
GLPTACTTPVEDGMNIKTKSNQINSLRVMAMELMLAGHPPDCTVCPKYLNCELQSLKQYVGITEELRVKRRPLAYPVNNSNPLFLHDFHRCILCGRCVRACYELRGVGVLSYIGKNRDVRISTAFDNLLMNADCVFCGACVEVCPTAAIRDRDGIIDSAKGRRASLIPCKYTCPAELDVPRYIRLIHEKKYADALAVIREKAPFPLSLGYVCNHPCESVCRRNEVNEAIAIRELKRFAAEHDDKRWKKNSLKADPTGNKVAVIGSGPAGLTAAYYLAKLGHDVTVMEVMSTPGGMLKVGIPEYRLPRDILTAEIAEIIDAGVKIKTDIKVDSLDKLFDEGYKAVLIAIGTHKGQKLRIPGSDFDGVLVSLDFLRSVNLGQKVKVGKRVVVMGGGNVAFDCARVARRLGAEEVVVACLECREAMLASSEEIEEGIEEGITIRNSRNFLQILGDNGYVSGVQCQEVSSFEFEEDGNLRIDVVDGSEHVLAADTVIFAMGQIPEVPEGYKLPIGRGNRIQIEDESMTTDREGVYCAGDAVTGTTSVIEAIAAGRKAAIGIDKFLGGKGVIDEVLVPIEEPSSYIGLKDDFACMARAQKEKLPVQQRLEGIDKMDCGFDEAAADEESNRCLQCDLRFKIARSKFWADYLSQ